jgi:hypothetical protein
MHERPPEISDPAALRKRGGIAYQHIADTYITMYTHFLQRGVRVAVSARVR